MRRLMTALASCLVLCAVGFTAARATAPADAQPGDTTPAAALELVSLPSTTFPMGTPVTDPGGYGGVWKVNEWPQRQVEVPAFAMQRAEVTVEEWIDFLIKVGHLMTYHPRQPVDYIGGEFIAAVDSDEPIRGVSWDEARAFCRWHGGDLPTEAQWERAAHGLVTPEGAYVWDEVGLTCERANVSSTNSPCASGPLPVGFHSPAGDTDEGLQDMIGNVGEWVLDAYASYPGGPPPSHVGTGEGTYRVIRGGSWVQYSERSRRAARSYAPVQSRSAALGFRCAKEVSP